MLAFLCAVFVVSGAAGLVYESIWVRYLGLFVGHGAYAQALVLVIFLGGMSAGAALVGRRAEQVRDPLRWYAYIELAVGAIGLVFHDVFVAVTAVAYDSVFPAAGAGAGHTVAKWTIAALLILPQSVLLGATFPLMAAGAVRRVRDRAGRSISLLYFANSLGAAAGVLLAGFWLIRVAGLPGTLLAAAIANLVVAGAAFVVAVRVPVADAAPAPEAPPTDARAHAADPAKIRSLLIAVAFGTAVSSFVYEIGWIRMLSLVLGSATHSFELMLSAFILGLALGALVIRRRSDAGDGALRVLGHVQLVMGVLAVATLPVYMESFEWMSSAMAAFTRTPAGYTAFSAARYAICLAVMLPATICAGMTLPLVTRLLMRGADGERAIGRVYAVNTLGSIVGVAAASLLLLPLMGLKWLLVAGAAIDVVLGAVILMRVSGRSLRALAPALSAAAVLLVVGLTVRFDQGVLTSGVFRYGNARGPRAPDVLFYRDGRTATVSVRRIGASGGLSLATNGKPDASLGPEWMEAPAAPGPFTHDASTQVLLPLVTLAHVPAARTAAIVGQGSGMSTHALLGDPGLRRVLTIEIEPEMIRASRAFYPANRRAFDDPRAETAVDDARSLFAARGERFDLILSEPSNPWVAGVSGLFTREFYAHVRRYLAPGGVFGQWLHLSEIDDGLVLSVVRAVAESFPSYSLYTVGNRDILIVAAADSTLRAPDWSVMRRRGIADDLRRINPLTTATLDALHLVDGATLAPLTAGGDGNSDFYPTLDLGAERSRYMGAGAWGFIGLAGDRFGLAALIEPVRPPLTGAVRQTITGVPRLDAMELATRIRTRDFDGATGPVFAAADRAEGVDRLLDGSTPPVEWHVWTNAIREAEEVRAGGSRGAGDSVFLARAAAFAARTGAPAEALAALSLLRGMSRRDDVAVTRAGAVLIAAARERDHWLPADLVREGVVTARLRLGDVRGAREAQTVLRAASARGGEDLRMSLLEAWLEAAERPR